MVTLPTIVLALTINSIASDTTIKHHNNQQVSSHLSAMVGNTQTINEWLNARYTMLASMGAAVVNDTPLSVLRQLAAGEPFQARI